MDRHAAAGYDETTSQPHELLEQIGQLGHRERVLIGENDQLRAQLVEMKREEKKKYDNLLMEYYNIKQEYEDDELDTVDRDDTANNQVTVKTEWDEEVKQEVKEEGEEDRDIYIKQEYEDDGTSTNTDNVTFNIKTESMYCDGVVVKEEIKEEHEEDHDIFIKQEYVTAYIKTESIDENVKDKIKQEIKEEYDEDDHDNDCGHDRCIVKKEEVSDDDANSQQLDDRVNADEVVQVNFNEPKDILPRDHLNTATNCVNFELSPSASEQMQLTNSSQIEQSVDQQVDKADHEPNEPHIHGHNQSQTTKQSKTRTRKRTAMTSGDVSTSGPKTKSKRTRVSTELHRTETFQEVSTAVAFDERKMDEQNGGGDGLGQIEDDDNETELGEEESGHYKIGIVKLKCIEDGCEDEVADRDELNDHFRVKHHISPYRCLAEGCLERFEQWNELGRHVLNNHSNISTWSCPHCTKTFKTHNRLYYHLHLHHFEGQFKCGYDGCHYDRVATLRSEIRNHQHSVHRKTTIYICKFHECGKSFNRKNTFNRHQQIHSGIKSFRCDWIGCGKSFGQKVHLNAHQRIHQKVKPFKCTWNMCDYASTHQSHVITHIRTKHFNLPANQKAQHQLDIEDHRNPRDYLLNTSQPI